MPRTERLQLSLGREYHSIEIASFVAQLDDLNRNLLADLKGATRAELEWQPSPGMNSIGMLLAHIAIVEVFWMLVATKAWKPETLAKALGIGMEDDGIPAPPRGGHPKTLAGWTLADYRALLGKARRHTKRLARAMNATAVSRRVRQRRRNGDLRIVEVRWILYHIVEHEAGHFYQANLLRHAYRDRRRRK